MQDTKLIKQSLGTLAKVQAMVEEQAYCIDIIQQIDSVSGMLKTVKSQLLSGHLDHCLEREIKRNKSKALSELKRIYKIA